MENPEPPTQPTGLTLPQAVRARLTHAHLRDDEAIELVAVAEDGSPHLAHLSVGEFAPAADGGILLALWRASRTSAAVSRSGKAVLYFTSSNCLFEVRCDVVGKAELSADKKLTGFHLRPSSIRDKRAPYASILSGTRFAYREPARVRQDWSRTRSALVAAFSETNGAESPQ